MKAAFPKKLLLLLIVPAFLLAFKTAADRSNFSGTWKLNSSKSEMGNFGRFAAHTVKADQKDDAITIAKTSPSFNGGDDVTVTETLSYDGKETETTVFGNSKRKSTARWSDDGKTFTISYTLMLDFNGQTNEIKGTETWTLSDDGKTLTVQNHSTSSQGERSTKAVYEKA
jgi:hypothetical protein